MQNAFHKFVHLLVPVEEAKLNNHSTINHDNAHSRPGCQVHAIIITSCHGNDDEAWSTSCLIFQYKPYIVELSFMETQKSHDSINEGPSLTTEGPPRPMWYMHQCQI